MFIFDSTPAQFSYPWEGLSFSDRFKLLKPKTLRVVYFYEAPDNSTFRYRVYNMISLINDAVSGYSATYFHLGDLQHIDDIIENCDIFVICRVKYSEKIDHLITRLKSRHVKIVFDVDDLIFNVDYLYLILNTLDQETSEQAWDFWFAMVGRIGQTLKMCDSALTTNKYLASQIEKFASIKCGIVPNFLNQAQLQVSEKIMQEKLASNFSRNSDIDLGYFSGTPSHNRDFDLIANSLMRVLKLHKKIRINIAGYMQLKEHLKPYLDRINFIPFQDYVNLQIEIGKVEVNLIPLQQNDFTNCKSELKYFDASICGTLSIASPTTVYRDAIQDGKNGYISMDHEWDEKIINLIENFDDYKNMAKVAYQHSVTNYAWYNQVDKIKEWLAKM